jgi:hypothetical protein
MKTKDLKARQLPPLVGGLSDEDVRRKAIGIDAESVNAIIRGVLTEHERRTKPQEPR